MATYFHHLFWPQCRDEDGCPISKSKSCVQARGYFSVLRVALFVPFLLPSLASEAKQPRQAASVVLSPCCCIYVWMG
jgi:hypothetical protein